MKSITTGELYTVSHYNTRGGICACCHDRVFGIYPEADVLVKIFDVDELIKD